MTKGKGVPAVLRKIRTSDVKGASVAVCALEWCEWIAKEDGCRTIKIEDAIVRSVSSSIVPLISSSCSNYTIAPAVYCPRDLRRETGSVNWWDPTAVFICERTHASIIRIIVDG